MEKNVNVRAETIREISKEKARIFRKEIQSPSLLEQAALEWRKKKELKERQREKKILKKNESLGHSFREAFAKEVVNYDKRKLFSSQVIESDKGDWVQYNPWKKEEDKKRKEIPLNMATVVAIRKKLVAKEWARALGKKTQDSGFCDLERQAAVWQQKREEEKKKEEEIKMRIEQHKEVLSKTLTEFGKRLREKKDIIDPKELADLMQELLENTGEIFDIEWQEEGCLIWIEPWVEKRFRRISGLDIPIIYRVKIDENFEIASYKKVENEEVIKGLRVEILNKSLRESLEKGVPFNIDDKEQVRQFLEDKLLEVGRLINLEHSGSGWLAMIEPWEEMRLRNTKRRGKLYIVTEQIQISWKDGKLEFISEGEEEKIQRVEKKS